MAEPVPPDTDLERGALDALATELGRERPLREGLVRHGSLSRTSIAYADEMWTGRVAGERSFAP